MNKSIFMDLFMECTRIILKIDKLSQRFNKDNNKTIFTKNQILWQIFKKHSNIRL